MKTTIILTDEQISQITKVKSDLLLSNKQKAIEKIEKKYQEDLNKLISEYKTYDITIKETKSKKETTTQTTEKRGRKKKIITE